MVEASLKKYAYICGTEGSIKLIGILSGFLIIRLLSVEQYALYVLALSMLGALSVLGDSGISNAVKALGGRAGGDREILGNVLASATHERRRNALIASLPIFSLFLFLALRQDYLLATILPVFGLVVTLFWLTLSTSLYQNILALTGSLSVLQGRTLLTEIARLLLVPLSLIIFPAAAVILFLNLCTQLWLKHGLWIASGKVVNLDASATAVTRIEIQNIVWRTLPLSIFYVSSSQITLLLLSYFGQTSDIAGIGALGRFSQVFALALSIFTLTLIPRFACVPKGSKHLFKFQNRCVLLATAFGIGVFTCGVLFPYLFLHILGPEYKNLKVELNLSLLSGALSFLLGVCNGLAGARAWIPFPPILISIAVLSQATCLLVLDVSTIRGALWFSILSALPVTIFRVGYLHWSSLRERDS